MPSVRCLKSTPVEITPRVTQLCGLFDLPPTKHSSREWTAHLPLEDRPDWQIGLIVGPSGCGKTTLARELFGDHIVDGFDWPEDRSLVDGFPASLGIKDITGLLSSVGFSTPPAWLRPFRCLSNGEQFRTTIARALAEAPELAVIDEFTSVVDRTVAQIGSAAIAKAVRRRPGTRFVGVACHFDIIDWLAPDWLYEPAEDRFTWRTTADGRPCFQRPDIQLTIRRVDPSAWRQFRHHHYLNTSLNGTAACFVAFVDNRPTAFTAVVHCPQKVRGFWREHRTVCLPDFQGVGIGNALSAYVASLFAATDRPYRSTTGNPAMIAHRRRSPLWREHSRIGYGKPADRRPHHNPAITHIRTTVSRHRLTATFEYCGPARPADAYRFEIIKSPWLPTKAGT